MRSAKRARANVVMACSEAFGYTKTENAMAWVMTRRSLEQLQKGVLDGSQEYTPTLKFCFGVGAERK